ncbi:MAG: ATP-binding cassette domain-containing protein, partial [Candidatus Limnocylindrales bacterium]
MIAVRAQVENPAALHDASSPRPVKVALRELNVYYGNFRAVREVTLDIPTSSVTAIIGPSGSGKSTLLRAINRMTDLVPRARATGAVELDGVNVLAPSIDVVELRRRVGMVFQRPNPFPKSIYDNVAYGPRLYGMRGKSLDELVESTLRGAALWDE